MWHYGTDTLVWLIVWSFIGSTLGFFSIRNNTTWTRVQRLMEYIKSVSIGIFFALPTFSILREYQIFSVENVAGLNIMAAGSTSFMVTDLIIKLWPKLIYGVSKSFSKLMDHLISKI